MSSEPALLLLGNLHHARDGVHQVRKSVLSGLWVRLQMIPVSALSGACCTDVC
jgi:hypothetical protein